MNPLERETREGIVGEMEKRKGVLDLSWAFPGSPISRLLSQIEVAKNLVGNIWGGLNGEDRQISESEPSVTRGQKSKFAKGRRREELRKSRRICCGYRRRPLAAHASLLLLITCTPTPTLGTLPSRLATNETSPVQPSLAAAASGQTPWSPRPHPRRGDPT